VGDYSGVIGVSIEVASTVNVYRVASYKGAWLGSGGRKPHMRNLVKR
jgi:hypothetical protein